MRFIAFILLSFVYSITINIPDEYPTIQQGIDAAVDGDTILVDQGIYYENLQITKSITLASHAIFDDLSNWVDNDNINNTIIDGGGSLNNDKSVILIFPIQNQVNNYDLQPSDPALVTLLDLDCCGGKIIQVTGASENSPPFANATSDTRTVYAYLPDNGEGEPNNSSSGFPHVYIPNGYTIANDLITDNISTNNDGMMLINGWPAYQFVGDSSESANAGGNSWLYFEPDGSISDNACSTDDDCENCLSPQIIGFTIQNGNGTLVRRNPGTSLETFENLGGGILFDISNPLIQYNKFIDNGSMDTYAGGAIYATTTDEDWDFNNRNVPRDIDCTVEYFNISHNYYYNNNALFGKTLANRFYENEFNMSESIYDVMGCVDNNISRTWINVNRESDLLLENIDSYLCGIDSSNVYVDSEIEQECINNNCGTFDNPFKTISRAMSMILPTEVNPITIHLIGSIYSDSNNQEIFPICMIDHTNIIGENRDITFLDANLQNRVISFDDVINSSLSNITIQNGITESYYDGAGIYLNLSNVIFDSVSLLNNHASDDGGAICSDNSSITINNSLIENNISEDNGGGICAVNSNITISNTTLNNNIARDEGGGIWSGIISGITLINSKIINNQSKLGGGIFFFYPGIFSSIGNSNIYLNNSNIGNDLYSISNDIISVVIDTFTVQYPSEYHAFPINNFSFDINDGILPNIGIDSDSVYVSVHEGSNLNDGSQNFPLKSIRYALATLYINENNPKEIILDEGIYSNSLTNENYPIPVINNLTISGQGPILTILDGEQNSQILSMYESHNSTIKGLSIINGYSEIGGGIYCKNSYPEFIDLSVRNNTAYFSGGGIYLDNSTPEFSDDNQFLCSIYNNEAPLGKDIVSYDTFIEATLDTFTVMFPTSVYAHPLENFNIEPLNNILEQIPNYIYISTNGDDIIGNGSESNPFASLTHALSVAISNNEVPLTIFIDEGYYNYNEDFPINLIDNIRIKGSGAEFTIIDGNRQSRIFNINNINNVIIEDISIKDGKVQSLCSETDPFYATGGGIRIEESSNIKIVNTILYNNSLEGGYFTEWHDTGYESTSYCNARGGAIYIKTSDLDIINCSLIDNSIQNNISSYETYFGSGIYISSESNVNIYNSILWDNHIFLPEWQGNDNLLTNSSSEVNVLFSNIEEDDYWGTMSLDPLFDTNQNFPYILSSLSPCIDSGTADFDGDGIDDIVNYLGLAPDMGAIESFPPISLGDLNQDYQINIFDIIILVEYALDGEYVSIGDLNQDETIDVLDIIALVSLILDN